jgi:uncharacterized protein YjgD (DUF1641 family)
MAQPIQLEAPPRDLRRERAARLESAGLDHAEALLEAYELLEQLHQSRTLELLRGAVAARGELAETAAAAVDTPPGINAIRNLILLSKMLGSIDPKLMESLASAIAGAAGQKAADTNAEPPGLWALFKQLRRRDARRALAFFGGFLTLFGVALGKRRAEARHS